MPLDNQTACNAKYIFTVFETMHYHCKIITRGARIRPQVSPLFDTKQNFKINNTGKAHYNTITSRFYSVFMLKQLPSFDISIRVNSSKISMLRLRRY